MGLSKDMLSHVFAGGKDLSRTALARALERIGCRLTIASAPRGACVKRAGAMHSSSLPYMNATHRDRMFTKQVIFRRFRVEAFLAPFPENA
jgi:hypothetical protein